LNVELDRRERIVEDGVGVGHTVEGGGIHSGVGDVSAVLQQGEHAQGGQVVESGRG
jgi:hypothetical protein